MTSIQTVIQTVFIYNVGIVDTMPLLEVLGIIFVEGLQIDQDTVKRLLSNIVRKSRSYKQSIVVTLGSAADYTLVFKSKNNLAEWRNPFGDKPVSIDRHLTKGQVNTRAKMNSVVNAIIANGTPKEEVKRIGIEFIQIGDQAAAKHYSEFPEWQVICQQR